MDDWTAKKIVQGIGVSLMLPAVFSAVMLFLSGVVLRDCGYYDVVCGMLFLLLLPSLLALHAGWRLMRFSSWKYGLIATITCFLVPFSLLLTLLYEQESNIADVQVQILILATLVFATGTIFLFTAPVKALFTQNADKPVIGGKA